MVKIQILIIFFLSFNVLGKSVELRKFNPVNGYYEAQQQIEQQVIEELPAAFVNHEQYVAQQTKVKLSKACENRLDILIQRLNASSNNKKEQLKRYINEYTQQCEDEAKKLVDKKQ